MLRAEELRIGNWVKSNVSGNDFRFTSYHFNDLNQILSCTPPKPRLEPIPLTEEWLVKFGFEKRDVPYQRRWLLNDFEIEKQGNLFAYVIWDESAPHLTQFRGHSKYVHQLQNLYFALTGKELTLKTND
jgi:hypothetical protein